MSNRQLPPNPPGCHSLTDVDAARLRRQHPSLWANPKTSCLTCRGEGTFRTREDGQVVVYDCNCVEQWKLHRWLLNSGVDTRYQRLSWADATNVNATAKRVVETYLVDADSYIASGSGLTLWATGRGTGKTLLATLLFKGVLAIGYDGYFIQFNEMLDAFSAGWRNEEERAWFIRRVRNAGLLVVDDIGREHKGRSEVAEAMFDTVVRARVAAAKPTLITTNYTPDEMRQGYGSNVLSLLSECNVEVEVPGADYRPQVNAQVEQNRNDRVTYPLVVL